MSEKTPRIIIAELKKQALAKVMIALEATIDYYIDASTSHLISMDDKKYDEKQLDESLKDISHSILLHSNNDAAKMASKVFFQSTLHSKINSGLEELADDLRYMSETKDDTLQKEMKRRHKSMLNMKNLVQKETEDRKSYEKDQGKKS